MFLKNFRKFHDKDIRNKEDTRPEIERVRPIELRGTCKSILLEIAPGFKNQRYQFGPPIIHFWKAETLRVSKMCIMYCPQSEPKICLPHQVIGVTSKYQSYSAQYWYCVSTSSSRSFPLLIYNYSDAPLNPAALDTTF